jgi:hypothetical protein
VEVVVLQVFVSLILVLGSLLLFAHSVKERNHEHASRLSLLPLEGDDEARKSGTKRALGGRQE